MKVPKVPKVSRVSKVPKVPGVPEVLRVGQRCVASVHTDHGSYNAELFKQLSPAMVAALKRLFPPAAS